MKELAMKINMFRPQLDLLTVQVRPGERRLVTVQVHKNEEAHDQA
jgi:hypothetical protein